MFLNLALLSSDMQNTSWQVAGVAIHQRMLRRKNKQPRKYVKCLCLNVLISQGEIRQLRLVSMWPGILKLAFPEMARFAKHEIKIWEADNLGFAAVAIVI